MDAEQKLLMELTREPMIAYFSMEIGINSNIPTYSGGLGVLAGDTIKSGADLELPMVAVTLLTQKGYFRQELDEKGRQIEHPVYLGSGHLYVPAEPARFRGDRGPDGG